MRGSVRGASEDALRIVVRAIVSNAAEGQRVDMAAGILPGYVTKDYVLERMGFTAPAEPLAEAAPSGTDTLLEPLARVLAGDLGQRGPIRYKP